MSRIIDRAHVDDVEKEVDVYVDHMEDYINALKLEIKNRIALISVLKQAETQLESDRKDVKMVAHVSAVDSVFELHFSPQLLLLFSGIQNIQPKS